MGSITSINLGTLYGTYANVPKMNNSENKSPLYAISDNSEASEIKELNRDTDWVNACVNSYNSPTNVKKLFITSDQIVDIFYTPFITKGQKTTEGCYRLRKVSDINDAINDIIKYEQSRCGDLAYSQKVEQNYKLTGKALSFLTTPWVLSNIEEVYIDLSCMFTENMINTVGANNVIRVYQSKNAQVLSKNISNIIEFISGTNIDMLTKQLQRLKVIGIIPNLNELITSGAVQKFYNNGVFALEATKNGINIKENSAFYFTERLKIMDDGRLSIRPYYKFDKEVLSSFADKFYADTQEERNKQREKIESEKKKQEYESKTPLEHKLADITDACDYQVARNVLRLVVARFDATTKNKIYSDLSEPVKGIYQDILK